MEEIQKLEKRKKISKNKSKEKLERVVIRLAGDSGDGMQLAGLKFTSASVLLGNDVSTFPDFPAEIRAPQGTLAGVSGFQIHFSSTEIYTPGDQLDTLVAMNPAALKINIEDLKRNGILIVNTDSFTARTLSKAGYSSNPLEDGSLNNFRVFPVNITKLNKNAVGSIEGISSRQINLTRNFFALGLISWLYDRPLDSTINWIEKKFKNRPAIVEANTKTLKAGFYFGETNEFLSVQYTVPKAEMEPGLYRYISGSQALALGLACASQLANRELFFGAYPITPASDLLHELVKLRGYGIKTFQAEDEIAAIGSIIGASFGGGIGITGTSGPGLALMSEALGLAVITELPLVLINVQRAGPSTGMPTKTEQGDLLQVLFGRNGESPLPVFAPQSPGDCFELAIKTVRTAIKYMTPVVLLSDAYLANNIDPWKIPDISKLQPIVINNPTEGPMSSDGRFTPYERNQNLARPYVVPGTKGLEHRIGGLEKEMGTGNVSYDPINHEKMVELRDRKISGIEKELPPQIVEGPMKGDLLVLSWGSTYGAAHAASENLRKEGYSVADTNLRFINPLPPNLMELLSSYKRILIPELNKGQLHFIIQARFSIKAESLTKVQGKPFHVEEIEREIKNLIGGLKNEK
ncbi:MAG: 2-oxoacid:acceptor oxidoreductase subunit alpha [Candidatus Hodarchaeales archaeon]|jgi:2-oxoglutarate ferredoxin oxidoreductase subunit alpha